jgi:membrane protease YdiL (CAAX protease family)
MNEPDNSSIDADAENRPATGGADLPTPARDSLDPPIEPTLELAGAPNPEPGTVSKPLPNSGQSVEPQAGQAPPVQTIVPSEPELPAEVHAEAEPKTQAQIWAHRENSQFVSPDGARVFSPDGSVATSTGLPPDRRVLSPNMWPDFATPLRGVDLLYLLAFYFVAGAVLTVMVAGAAMLGFHISAATLQKSVADRSMVMIVSQGLLSVATVIFLYAVIRSRSDVPFWRALGWRPFRLASHDAGSQLSTILKYVLGGFGLALAVGWLSRFFNQNTQLPMEDLFRSRQTVLLLMGLGILVAPVVEETVFRGCIFPVLARKLGAPGGVIVTGVLFGVAHAQQLWGGWGEIALLICVGIVLTYVRARAGTVAASYLVHVSYNTILFSGFYFATHGLRYFPPS